MVGDIPLRSTTVSWLIQFLHLIFLALFPGLAYGVCIVIILGPWSMIGSVRCVRDALVVSCCWCTGGALLIWFTHTSPIFEIVFWLSDNGIFAAVCGMTSALEVLYQCGIICLERGVLYTSLRIAVACSPSQVDYDHSHDICYRRMWLSVYIVSYFPD